MKLRWTLILCALVSACRLFAQPNVILVITDDQGYGDLSVHGNPVLKTPHLDQLHRESVRLTDFHVAPMCSPTRGQLMTGRDAMKNGCTAVCQGRSMMRSELPTMANFFANSGYATGHFGKWHLGDSYPHRPQDRGFDVSLHHRAWGITSLADYWKNTYYDPVLSLNGIEKKYEGYCTDIFFNQAMNWISECKKQNQPFFLYLPTNTPHVPNVCPDKYSAPYRGSYEGRPIPSEFYGMIANIDENMGKLDDFLKTQELDKNTIVIFMSDNGTQSTQAKEIFNAGMRDKKTSVYEGGHRVPFFIRWPNGKLSHGSDIDDLIEVQDVLPTLIDLCELKGASNTTLDGLSLADRLRGKVDALPDRKLVVQYRTSGEPWNPAVVMWNKWRLIGGNQLFHVGRDPGQQTNVAAQHPEVVQAMAEHYNEWHKEAKPLFDTPRWITLGSEKANPMILYAQDWVGDYCDNFGGLTKANGVGYWNVVVDKAGVYEIELRRWPKESGKTLVEGINGPDHPHASARPIAAANLQIAGANYTVDTKDQDTHASFRIELAKGKAQLLTHLLDSADRILCSAMYVYLRRVGSDPDDLTIKTDRAPKDRVRAAPRNNPRTRKKTAGLKLGPTDILLADFEGADHGDWTTTGTAFGQAPTDSKGRVETFIGEKLIDTFLLNGSDKPTGTLSSPPFKLERKYLNFLIGGGKTPKQTCVNLRIGDHVIYTAVGSATKNERAEKIMHWVSWDVSKHAGKTAQVEIVDAASGGWGHIMVDHMFQSNQSATKAK